MLGRTIDRAPKGDKAEKSEEEKEGKKWLKKDRIQPQEWNEDADFSEEKLNNTVDPIRRRIEKSA